STNFLLEGSWPYGERQHRCFSDCSCLWRDSTAPLHLSTDLMHTRELSARRCRLLGSRFTVLSSLSRTYYFSLSQGWRSSLALGSVSVSSLFSAFCVRRSSIYRRSTRLMESTASCMSL